MLNHNNVVQENKWLGEVEKITEFDRYAVVQLKRSNNGIWYLSYIDDKSTCHSYLSFDAAIVGCIAYAYEGCNHHADEYFMKMIRKEVMI